MATPTSAIAPTECDWLDIEYEIMGLIAPPIPIPTEIPVISIPTLAEYFIPLFEYGDGTGTIGCVSVAATIFMSEEEAFAILSSVLKEAGLMLSSRGLTLQDANIPVTSRLYPPPYSSETTQGELVANALDGLFETLPVRFVSSEDVFAWDEFQGNRAVIVDVYRIKEAAEVLSVNNPGLVVFYDPVSRAKVTDWANYSDEVAPTQEEARARSAQLLRQQAEAFIEWLNAEGLY